ncbi:pyocin activator protein PrtN [Buttiauxella sp. JUb87]|uniref:pyocin activator PrtN family protein n=1 Tax=Buttiauxella sp. JUb87 TaxID=2485129 RepID=UPI00105DD992|nr:pyocin activator PrtN family protein [Buttiauxella sp. JUb87]TDN54659.1 pyocin activator protein PrtN [Buttiauxella sp. JUb87]
MNTVFLLLAEFGTPTILLADVSEKYFGMKPATAEKKALLGELPIATFRASESQKAPRMIHVQDLADHIDQQRKKGKALFEQMRAN